MIWGITLEPGQAHTQVIEDEVHLSMATMESRGCIGSKADNFSHVVIKTGTTEYLLCTLVNGITYQQCLDLKLMPSDKVTFSVQGTNVVYLTGYSFASSETEQEIIQTEDWIDNPVLEGDISQDNLAYAEDAGSFQPSEVQNEVQRQHQQTKGDEVDISDREKFSVEFEVPAEEEYQYIPERVHQQVTDGTPCTSSQGQPQDHHPPPGTVAGGSGVEIKEEIHTVVETEEDIITDQPIEDVPGQSGHQSIHQPSTSAGQNNQGKIENVLSKISQPLTRRKTGSARRARQSDFIIGQSEFPGEMFVQTNRTGDGSATIALGLRGDSKMAQNLKCRFCGKQFFYPSKLKIHETKHTGERNYKCDICGMSFRLQSNKIAHETIHTGVRPFPCKYCGKSFRQQSVLKTHERIHTGERPYVCIICGKAFRQHGHLEKHSKKHERV